MSRRLLFLEPSKVGTQHITLIEAYLQAAQKVAAGRVELFSCASLWNNLSTGLRGRVAHHAVPVIDPDRRLFLAKVPLEFLVTVWTIFSKRREDVLLVTCLFSPSLYLLEMLCRVWKPANVHVVLHSELEALADRSISPGITGYGYWCRKWWSIRTRNSSLGLVVIADQLRDRLLALGHDRLAPEKLSALSLPASLPEEVYPGAATRARPKVCFVGQRTRFKGYEEFCRLAARLPGFEWVAIGGGSFENLSTGEQRRLASPEDFPAALTDCDVAVFPYTRGYDLSMSAAVLDAIAAGLFVIATSRATFQALSEELGPDMLTCVESSDEIGDALTDWSSRPVLPREERRRRIARSSLGETRLAEQ